MVRVEFPPIQLNVDRARAYVLAHGGLRDQARAQAILAGARPPKEVVSELERLQNGDGGFPLLQQTGAPSAVDTTCFLLAQLRDLPPLGGSPMASRALAFLRRMQSPDGSWSEPEAVQPQAPPWSRASHPEPRPYLTANAAWTVALMDPDHLDPVRRAADWLRRGLAEWLPGAQSQTRALAGAVFARMGWREPAKTCLGLSPADLHGRVWWLTALLEAEVGGAYLPPALGALADLAAAQAEDGAWPAEPGLTAESTLMALRIFKGYGLI